MVVVVEEDLVNHGRIGQSMSSLLRIADGRGRLTVIAADASVGVWALRVLVSYLVPISIP